MSSEKSSAKLIAELYAEGHPSGPKLVDGKGVIIKIDNKFGILCLLTFLAGMVDAIISFCFSMYVTLAVTSVIWFVIALLWCLMAMKFRHIAYESECQRISLNIQDTLRRAPITQKEAQ